MEFEYGLQDINEMSVALTLDDGTEMVCGVEAIFPVQGKDYIALVPFGEENTEVLLYRFELIGDDLNLESIDNDDEFKLVAEAYDSLVDDFDLFPGDGDKYLDEEEL